MSLTNVEFALLQIIGEKETISGYQINKLVEERNYHVWAEIGTTSIYLGLEKLKKKKLVRSSIDIQKTGKGPLPKNFSLKEKGHEILKQSVLDALSNYRERDKRFDLGIAGLPFVTTAEAIDALEKRKTLLNDAAQKVREKLETDGENQLPFHLKILFEHPLFLIRHELDFMDAMIGQLKSKILD